MSKPLDILDQLAEHLKKALQTDLSVQMRVASGTLINSIEAVVKETMSGFEIVGSAVYYAKYVENGRRAGAKGVPIEALIEWIRIKPDYDRWPQRTFYGFYVPELDPSQRNRPVAVYHAHPAKPGKHNRPEYSRGMRGIGQLPHRNHV
ncbi:MAG: hypothetical protein ACLR8Y_15435 [Alistipes indistinctus]